MASSPADSRRPTTALIMVVVPVSALVLLLAGCAGTGAPDGWLSTAADSAADPYGSWIAIEQTHGTGYLAGEFMAVDRDSVYVLVTLPTGTGLLRSVSLSAVRRAKITFFDPDAELIGSWVAAGALSTVSHGVWLAISLPVWLAAGGGVSTLYLENARVEYPDLTWSELAMYARFPQGPPPALRDLEFRPKTPDLAPEIEPEPYEDLPEAFSVEDD